ncbi:hypothetical protein HMPREF3056_07935 [Corynebacterium sp. HMSC056F09]|uniref:DUF559 domain-containing protein n=1 Tax=Corynebacterium sp. HMSC056F09 TaxID=1739548 RepID=UPI0008C89AB8|nr:DUF559 domain-containing protein [Corynebacterium sp. HMSC056F09]OFO21830.1 hypothetical protein HMPREF3056_07935 [Corynebacterium sp. HMSC056F09]
MIDDSHLIYLRPLPNDHPVWKQLASGELIRLTSRYAINSEYYSTLPYYQRHLFDIVAFGRSAHRSVLVERSAAKLLGLWMLPSRNAQVVLARQSKTVPPRRQWDSKVMYRKMWLPASDIIERFGLRCTSVARTCIDVARLATFEEGLMAVDSTLRKRLVSIDELRSMITAMGRVKGAAQARRVITHATALAESPYESYARGMLIVEGLGKKLVVQPELQGGYRPDLLINGKIIMEIDGAVKYDGATYGKSTEAVIRAERQREKYLQNLGYIVLRYSPRDLLQNREQVLNEVRGALNTVQPRSA